MNKLTNADARNVNAITSLTYPQSDRRLLTRCQSSQRLYNCRIDHWVNDFLIGCIALSIGLLVTSALIYYLNM
jgi:hypothetical protein